MTLTARAALVALVALPACVAFVTPVAGASETLGSLCPDGPATMDSRGRADDISLVSVGELPISSMIEYRFVHVKRGTAFTTVYSLVTLITGEIKRRASMERLDSATTGLIEQEVRGRFPEGTADVAVLQYGDDPAVEPDQIVIQVTVEAAAPAEGQEDPLDVFHRVNRDAIQQLQRELPQRWPQANRFRMVSSRTDGGKRRIMMLRMPTPDEAKDDLTPVMARLGPTDLETLDTLITAGFAANRAQAVRWALARIRERPAYAELREHAKEIENLRSQF
jgi:hypothetical protein